MPVNLRFLRDKCIQTSKFAMEAYAKATSVPYGYILVDLKPDQDEQCRLRTNIFPGEMQYVYVKK